MSLGIKHVLNLFHVLSVSTGIRNTFSWADTLLEASPQEYHSVLSSNHGVTPRVYQRPGLNEYKEGFYSTCQAVPGVEQPD